MAVAGEIYCSSFLPSMRMLRLLLLLEALTEEMITTEDPIVL